MTKELNHLRCTFQQFPFLMTIFVGAKGFEFNV